MIALNKWEVFAFGYFLGLFSGCLYTVLLDVLIRHRGAKKINDNLKNKTNQLSSSFKPRTGNGQRD